jgi:hypothetical protein
MGVGIQFGNGVTSGASDDARDDPAGGAETVVGLNSVADGGGRTRNGGSLTAIRTPALTVIPANAGIQCFSRLCLVAMDARVRRHDIQGASTARKGQATLAEFYFSLFPTCASHRVLNKILKPRNAVTITVHSVLIPIDL